MMCKCKKEPIKVDVKVVSPFVNMQRKGDLIDINCCDLIKTYKGRVRYITDQETERVTGIEYEKGSIFRVSLGFAMKMPPGKKAEVYQRSGTRKNFGVLLTNHVGQIDNSFQGNGDIWQAEFYAVEDGTMLFGERILQFEIVDIMPEVQFNYVDNLEAEDRGGFGSTGK